MSQCPDLLSSMVGILQPCIERPLDKLRNTKVYAEKSKKSYLSLQWEIWEYFWTPVGPIRKLTLFQNDVENELDLRAMGSGSDAQCCLFRQVWLEQHSGSSQSISPSVKNRNLLNCALDTVVSHQFVIKSKQICTILEFCFILRWR